MYPVLLIAALAAGADPASTVPPEAPARSSGGFFHRLFSRQPKDSPAQTPSPVASAQLPATAPAASPPKSQGGFFKKLFKCSQDGCVSSEQEKKWERSCLGNPD